MAIEEINLLGFRNYIQESIRFELKKIILIGNNAQGKSNLLEAIQVLSLGKSKRAKKDAEMVNWDLDSAVIQIKSGKLNIAIQIRRSGRRTIKVNENTIKPRELPGQVLSVSFMVDDLDIVSGSPSSRRDWLDNLLIQLSHTYREKLDKFNKALSQRNSFIKDLIKQGIFFHNLHPKQKEELEVWNGIFLETANEVIKSRIELLESLNPLASKYYSKIAKGSEENLELNYLGKLISPEELQMNLPQDFARGYTSIGPQRHDIELTINNRLASSFASQGQRRSIVLALKLAELEALRKRHNRNPILLLDDVLAELDEDRQDFLLEAVDEDTQVIITTTHLGVHLEKWSNNSGIYTIKSGSIAKLKETTPA